jgi:glycerophosphoryl diester phosphodiesterase
LTGEEMALPVFWKIGHRGVCGYEPENTRSSFKKAVELGVDVIEFDVRRTRDGHLAVIHDARVDRTTNGKGLVKDFTYAELLDLDAGRGERIPLLEEILNEFAPQVFINIELKEKDTALLVLEKIRRRNCLDRVLISSFDTPENDEGSSASWNELLGLKKEEPKIAIGFIAWQRKHLQRVLDIAKEGQIYAIGAFSKTIAPADVELAHRYQTKIFVWLVNDPEEARRFKEMGADGLVSNYPDRI